MHGKAPNKLAMTELYVQFFPMDIPEHIDPPNPDRKEV